MLKKYFSVISKLLIGLWVALSLIFAFFAVDGYFSNSNQASMDPKNEIFEAQERIDKEFPNPVHTTPFEILANEKNGDVLTRDVLLELYEKSEELRSSEIGKEYLVDFEIPFLGKTNTLGLFSLADVVENFLNEQGSSLKEATDEEVKDSLNLLFEDTVLGPVLRARLSGKAEFKDNQWVSPALAFFVSSDNEKLGGGVFRRTVGGDSVMLAKEQFNRDIEESLQSDKYRLFGIGIDLNTESEEEGYSVPVMSLILLLLLSLATLTGFLFRSFRLFLFTIIGLTSLFIWIKGFPFITSGIIKPSLTTDVILPIAFMAFGVDFLIHIVHQYKEGLKTSQNNFRESFVDSFKNVNTALFLAMLTTAVAFGANYVSSVEAVKAFAVTGVFASFAAYFIMGVITPLMFVLWGSKDARKTSREFRWINMGAVMNFVFENKKFVIALLIIMTVFFGSGVMLVEKSLDPKDFISSDSNFVVSLDERDVHYGGTRGEEASIYIKGDFRDPEVSGALRDILVSLDNNSFLAHTKEGQLILPYGLPKVNKINDNLYSERIIFEVVGTREQSIVKEAYESLMSDLEIFDGIADYEIVGSPFTRDASLEAVTSSLVNTILMALLMIFIILLVSFRSFFYSSITLVPMLLVILWIYGLMGVYGFSLNFITATIAAVSLGVGIDYSVHIIQRFRQEYKEGIPIKKVFYRVGQTTGFAIFVSALSSVIGFLFLSQAPMPLFATYGLLVSIMITFSFIAAFTILPLLLYLKFKK